MREQRQSTIDNKTIDNNVNNSEAVNISLGSTEDSMNITSTA
jgi:hypothetical protein